jgi:DNA-binding response OmpR family regulator
MREYNLLLVDDDPFILEGIGEDLEKKGYQVTRADNGDTAVRLLEKNNFVIILTGYGDMTSAIDALRNKADDYLLKPCESAEMAYRVNRCLEQAELFRKIKLYQKILPMCCVCKKIRIDQNNAVDRDIWISVEKFIHEQAELDITSSYCPDCAKKTMDQFTKKNR